MAADRKQREISNEKSLYSGNNEGVCGLWSAAKPSPKQAEKGEGAKGKRRGNQDVIA